MSLPDNQTIYANLIKALSENQFKELVQVLNKCKYETKDVFITDGCYDGGNDLRIIKSGKDIRRNIQVTVQTTGFEAKVMDDVAKAAKNVKQNAYLAQLDYYGDSPAACSRARIEGDLFRAAYRRYQTRSCKW